jgi:flagellar motor switch protein FliN/FliY
MSHEESLSLQDLAAPQAAAPEPEYSSAEEVGQHEPSPPRNSARNSADELKAVYDIPVQVSAVLGKANMQVSELLKLGRGAVVELDRKVGEPIEIYVNNRLVARGEVVVIEDRLGVTMTEIIQKNAS